MHLLTVLYCSAKEEAIKQRRKGGNGQSDTSHGISDLLLAPSPFMHARWSQRAELATLRKLFLRRVPGVVAFCSTPAAQLTHKSLGNLGSLAHLILLAHTTDPTSKYLD